METIPLHTLQKNSKNSITPSYSFKKIRIGVLTYILQLYFPQHIMLFICVGTTENYYNNISFRFIGKTEENMFYFSSLVFTEKRSRGILTHYCFFYEMPMKHKWKSNNNNTMNNSYVYIYIMLLIERTSGVIVTWVMGKQWLFLENSAKRNIDGNDDDGNNVRQLFRKKKWLSWLFYCRLSLSFRRV